MLTLLTTAPTEITDMVSLLINSFRGGNWSIFASAIVLLLVWLATKAPGLSTLIKGKGKVITAAVAGVLMAVATTLISGGDWISAIGSGLSVGLGATGLFEIVKRRIANQPIDQDGNGELDPLK